MMLSHHEEIQFWISLLIGPAGALILAFIFIRWNRKDINKAHAEFIKSNQELVGMAKATADAFKQELRVCHEDKKMLWKKLLLLEERTQIRLEKNRVE